MVQSSGELPINMGVVMGVVMITCKAWLDALKNRWGAVKVIERESRYFLVRQGLV